MKKIKNKKYDKWEQLLKEKNVKFKNVREYIKVQNQTGAKDLTLKDVDVNFSNYKKFASNKINSIGYRSRTRAFIITDPFLYYESMDEIKNILTNWKSLTQFIFSLEVTKDNKRLYVQGFVEFSYPNWNKYISKKLNCKVTRVNKIIKEIVNVKPSADIIEFFKGNKNYKNK